MSRFRDEKECIDVAEKDSRQKNITQLTTLKKVFFTLFVQLNRFYSGRGELRFGGLFSFLESLDLILGKLSILWVYPCV